jgi:hypothetical protein
MLVLPFCAVSDGFSPCRSIAHVMVGAATFLPLQSVTLPDGTEIDVAVGLGGSAVGAFLSTLLVGAILAALAPEYTRRMMRTVREDIVGSFVYGFVSLVLLVVVTIALVITLIGILVAFPLVLLSSVVWAGGAAIGYLTIAERLVGVDDDWLKPLLVAAAINGGLTLTAVGGLISFCVGATGFGAVLRDWL